MAQISNAQPSGTRNLSLDELRARASALNGKRFWRSLEELADTPEHRAFLENEFPYDPANEPQELERRDVLKWMAASAALAGLSGCTKMPEQKIVPYVTPPEEIIPGRPLFYATSLTQDGIASGVLVESHMGRPTKVEGNPQHPASLGATDFKTQAAILGLYDPDRSQTIIREGHISSWGAFVNTVNDLRTTFGTNKGDGLRILTGTITSPTVAAQIQDLLKQFPSARWHQWNSCSRDNAREGAKLALGQYANTVYRFDRADVILSLDSNFLYEGPGAVRYARDFAARRDPQGSQPMNRLYVIEQSATTTGAMADHRLAVRATDVESIARAIAGSGQPPQAANVPKGWVEALVRDLQSHRGRSIVIAGDAQPPVVHAIAHAINAALGNIGSTVIYTDPVEANPESQLDSLRQLCADIAAGRVHTLFLLGVNPVYDAPADLDFTSKLLSVDFRAHLGLYEDETAELCHWHIPMAHELESWGDARGYDGTAGIIQPLIAPLYDGRTAHEILGALAGQPDKSPHDFVGDFWRGKHAGADFDAFWQKSLHDGVIVDTAFQPRQIGGAKTSPPPSANSQRGDLEIVFRPDPTIGDGSLANNGWLQELPKPITRLAWDNTAQMSPATAARLQLASKDYVRISLNGSYVQAPVFVVPGHADNSVTLHLGYGRKRAGRVGSNIGFDANLVRASSAPDIAFGAQISKLSSGYALAAMQLQQSISGDPDSQDLESENAFLRNAVRVGTVDEYRKDPKFAQEMAEPPPRELSLYPGVAYSGYSWGMAIDLNKCVGCNACVVACQSENNISVVGKEEVMRGRIMHWIRMDTYFRGGIEDPETYFEPVPCMHCENAPCEGVCPVGATVHSPEGLNEMIYNRCVGTRYCSNNCPYKVRRFNFRLYADFTTPSLEPMRNPNVSVRSRGVMEKCSYCVQRIQAAKIDSEREDRFVRDGEIQTACQQACPAQAIVFGDINNKENRVAKWKADPRNYTLLSELNTRPRTTYLARLRNPNPEMPGEKAAPEAHGG
ncbi:MAG TPA: TAT-variant-translocated molybdopterin oxidoreductase [Candidatus Acidoferrales bacterium]|nr:TAT-variant-translocated molybdopterin oxidoreductase [Candidatus Acidoferrales bacterium]